MNKEPKAGGETRQQRWVLILLVAFVGPLFLYVGFGLAIYLDEIVFKTHLIHTNTPEPLRGMLGVIYGPMGEVLRMLGAI